MSEELQGVPPRAYTALGIAIQAYEPEATAAIIKSPAALLQVLLEAARRGAVAAAPAIRAAEQERIQLLVQALANLYDVVWNKTATLESDIPGYNLISYDDTNAIDEAGGAVEELLASGAIADLLGGQP